MAAHPDVPNINRGRTLRNLRARFAYPFWLIGGRPPPDNHVHKVKRIRALGRKFGCETFIETGTFFGQTVAAVHRQFVKTFSVELSPELHRGNEIAFQRIRGVKIFRGDSSAMLDQMIRESTGRILYWLDGHYSGGVTAKGTEITPIFEEMETIKQHKRFDDCILIDDLRLFTGHHGYPLIAEVKNRIARLSPNYEITVDRDCLMALPRRY
ncbi:MAG: hypothetical protein ABIY47_14145 [Opitutaceae bacterium]